MNIPSYARLPMPLFDIPVDNEDIPVVVLTDEMLPEKLRKKQLKIYVLLGFLANPGNIKRIPASHMINRALETGRVKEGGTLVEPTSGNMGVALAYCARKHNIQVCAIVSNDLPEGKRIPIERQGARVVTEEEMTNILGLRDTVDSIELARLYEQSGDGYFLNQYQNEWNPESYYKLVAPRFWDGIDGKASLFVSSVGSCGTLLGLGTFFKEQNVGLEIVPTMPYLGQKIDGLRDIDRLKPVHDRRKLTAVDEQIDEITARAYSDRLNKFGIPGGPSSGAAFGTILHILQDRLARGSLEQLRCADGTIGVITTFADTMYPYG